MAKLSNSLDGDNWRFSTARVGFPILVEYAQSRRAITYGEWDREIVKRRLGKHMIAVRYGGPAGSIGDACQEYANYFKSRVPMLNLMVINQYGIPGKGADYYIERFSRQFLHRVLDPKDLSNKEKKAIIEQAHEEIFDFPDWVEVLDAFGLKPTDGNGKPRPSIPRRPPNQGGWHFGPESEAHKALKHCIANTPQLIGLPQKWRGQEEQTLWSGDEVDVFFVESAVAVEVKTQNASFEELHRGIFQCVKYRAVLRAQQIHDQKVPSADCVLAVGGKLPKGLQEIASLLHVRFFQNIAGFAK